LAWPQLQKGVETKCSTAALPKLFEREGKFLLLQCHAYLHLLFTIIYKRLPEGGQGFGGLVGGWNDWLTACENDIAGATAAGCCVSVSLRAKT
jgi:hypothetical protein